MFILMNIAVTVLNTYIFPNSLMIMYFDKIHKTLCHYKSLLKPYIL